MALKDRIQEIIDAGFSKAAVARAAGVTPAAVTHWLSSGSKEIKGPAAAGIQVATGFSAAWVASGKLPKMASNTEQASLGGTRIPLISAIQAGMWTEIQDHFEPGDAEDWLLTDTTVSKNAFALQIKGNSMLPDFSPGDRVIIDPNISPSPGDFVAAKNGDDEATFKKYRPRGMDASGDIVFELVPLNEDFPSIRSDAQPISIIGTMVEHRKYRRPQ